jgi:hypothetical protein
LASADGVTGPVFRAGALLDLDVHDPGGGDARRDERGRERE